MDAFLQRVVETAQAYKAKRLWRKLRRRCHICKHGTYRLSDGTIVETHKPGCPRVWLHNG